MDKTFHKILVPIDFSPYSSEALRYAGVLAEQFDALLLVLHVVDKDFETVVVHHSSGGRAFPSPLLGPFAATFRPLQTSRRRWWNSSTKSSKGTAPNNYPICFQAKIARRKMARCQSMTTG